MFGIGKRALRLNMRSKVSRNARAALPFHRRFFRCHIVQDQAARFLSATSQPGRPRREGGIHSRKQAFLYPREKYSAASGLNGKIEVHYGQNRPYFRPIDSTSRGALEKVPARVATGGPAAFRPPLCTRCVATPRRPPIRPTTIRWKRSCSPSLSTRKSVSTPSRKFFRTQGCFVKLLQGWILDLYPNQHGMTLWLIDRNQSHYRLTDSFAPAFYVSGTGGATRPVAGRRTAQNHGASHAIYRADRPLAECGPPGPRSFRSPSLRISSAGDDGCTSSTRNCSSTTATSWWRRCIAGRSGCFRFPLWKSKPTTKEKFSPSHAAMMNGRSIMKCRHSRSCRFGYPALRGSIPRTVAARRSKSKWTVLAGSSTKRASLRRFNLRGLLKRHDPDVILSEWGDSTILPLLRQQAERLRSSLPLNRDESAAVQQSRGRSYTSYGRILFKASSITLFGRIHVDKQNSFISEKCDFAGLWELARLTKLPIQYAARTTTGTGISYMQMELAHRDGVLIPEQKAEPEDPKRPDELSGSGPRRPRLRAETRLHTQRRGTGFREPVPEHHGAIQYLPRNRELPVLPRRSAHSRTRLPHLPEAKRDHEPRGRTAYRQAMRTQEAAKDIAARYCAQDANCSVIR